MLIGEGEVVLWSDAGDSPVSLPDSRARWEAIWSRRERLVEIAHSHPIGPLAFSKEDETTMEALVSALGRPLAFSVVAPTGMIRSSAEDPAGSLVEREPWWASLLRLASSMSRAPHAPVRPERATPAPPGPAGAGGPQTLQEA